MKRSDAALLARGFMALHGLRPAWAFMFDGAIRRAGMCRRSSRLITLSGAYVDLNDVDEVIDTILHEIAHALTNGGHNAKWRAKAIEIGCNGKRYYDKNIVKMPARKWQAVCPKCGPLKSQYHRRLNLGHRKCGARLQYVAIKGAQL